jgi:hypothetical protein
MATLTPQAFTEKRARATLSERASYVQHFLDLCAVLGQPAPAEIDKRDFYTFEKGVEKSGLYNPCPTGLATNLTTGRAEIGVPDDFVWACMDARGDRARPSLVQASLPLDPQTAIRAGDEAPEHALGSFEEPDAVQQRVPYTYSDAVVGVLGDLVVDVVVLFGEDYPLPLEPDRESRG